MTEDYELADEVPGVDDHIRLRAVSGLSPRSRAATEAGLPRTLHGVVVRRDGRAVGMGRVIGDGGIFYQVVDIAVDPAHQGQGLGKAIVGRLVERLRAVAHPGAYVSLIADGEAHRLYAQFGFAPTAPEAIGMSMRIG